jgi:hypothetical protein
MKRFKMRSPLTICSYSDVANGGRLIVIRRVHQTRRPTFSIRRAGHWPKVDVIEYSAPARLFGAVSQ